MLSNYEVDTSIYTKYNTYSAITNIRAKEVLQKIVFFFLLFETKHKIITKQVSKREVRAEPNSRYSRKLK